MDLPSYVRSVNGVLVRLNEERWNHIHAQHRELRSGWEAILECVEAPAEVRVGPNGELLAIREIEDNKWLVVVYLEQGETGFVVTAYETRRRTSIEKRELTWRA